jgi:hypothetical protein
MPLPRLHLFEFEDQPWFPALIRRGMTDYLAEMIARARPYDVARPVLRRFLERHRGATIVDLCSGGGGPWPQLVDEMVGPDAAARLVLTDAFPNPDALSRFRQDLPITYRTAPQRATDSPPEANSVRTLFSSFHHFAPPDAVRVLQSAVDGGTPIAIFEATHRSVAAVAATLVFVPLMVLVMTPFIRPFRWWRLVLTYLLPAIPLFTWWDGTVSCLRTYRPEDLAQLTRAPGLACFVWESGEVRSPKTPLPVTYLVGTPRARAGA